MFDDWESNHLRDVRPLPAGLDELPAGPALGMVLSTVDIDRLSASDRVTVLRAHDRMASYHQAQRYAAMTSIADAHEDLDEVTSCYWSAGDAAATEIRVALSLTRRMADSELTTAVELSRRLPAVWRALLEGQIDVRRTGVIVDGTSHLTAAAAAAIAEVILPDATTSTTGQLAARIRRLCITLDPANAARRLEHSVADRRVSVESSPNGTAHLCGFDLPPHRVAAISRWIDRAALAIKTTDEARTLPQIRADVFLDLMEHRCGGRRRRHRATSDGRGVVDIRVDLATLAELSSEPGELAGYGPIIADIAREVAANQPHVEWRYAVTDDRGDVIASGTTRRRPDARHRRLVQVRDERCVFPGCRIPASSCDIDHITPWSEGGPTTHANTATLCRHDHVARHHGWRYHRTDTGGYRWVSPLGHSYTTSRHPP